MRWFAIASAALVGLGGSAPAQMKENPEWVKEAPTLGDPLPDLTVYGADGKEFKTADLRGHYTVLAFGCLT